MELPFLKMYFMRMSDLPECVGIYYVCACCPWKPEQGMGFCTAGVRKKNLDSLGEKSVLLATKTSF